MADVINCVVHSRDGFQQEYQALTVTSVAEIHCILDSASYSPHGDASGSCCQGYSGMGAVNCGGYCGIGIAITPAIFVSTDTIFTVNCCTRHKH